MSPYSAMIYPMLRVVLIFLGFFFGLGLGRALASHARTRLLVWVLRVVAVLLGVCWRGIDLLAIAGIVLMLATVGWGYYQGLHPPTEDHLEEIMFRKD